MGAVFSVFFFALLARLYVIQVAGHETYAAARAAQSRGTLVVESPRGVVHDAEGEVLAVSIPVESVWANPSAIGDAPPAARALAGALGLDEAEVLRKLLKPGLRFPDPSACDFVWIRRKASPSQAAAVRRLLTNPLFRTDRKSPEPRRGLVTEFSRRYPHGPLLGQVLGVLSEDPRMREGVERSMDSWLGGNRKSVPVVVDGFRRTVAAPPMEPAGSDVTLTIDVRFQDIVEEELDAACAEHKPGGAMAVAVDPRSGQVLAVASRPAFDPNDPGHAAADARRNRVLTDPYEPGSTLKPFLAAWALELGLATPGTKFDCENGAWKVGARTLHDHHPYGTLTLTEGIEKSSNIFAAKLGALILGRDRMIEGLRRFGFGARTGIDLPAEDEGRLYPASRWDSFTLTSVPIGHEIMVTPLQLAVAMGAIANRGVLHAPFVVRRVTSPDGAVLAENQARAGRRVLGEKAAGEMIEILKGVVRNGTGTKAQVPGVEVGGKTGTTQKTDPATGQYTHERFISSFVGFAPADGAKVCVAVVIDEPEGAYYGGTVAAPVVGRILRRGLVHLR